MLWNKEKVISRAAKLPYAAIFARELLLSGKNFGSVLWIEVGKVREVRVAVIVAKLLARFPGSGFEA